MVKNKAVFCLEAVNYKSLQIRLHNYIIRNKYLTRSQAVARIAVRTASQQTI